MIPLARISAASSPAKATKVRPEGAIVADSTSGTLQRGVMVLLVAFLLVFPKGGIKVAGIPLTWGYLALGIVAACTAFGLLRARSFAMPKSRLAVVAALLPFQAISWFSFLVNGVDNAGFAISFLVSVCFLPVTFVLVLGPYLDHLDLGYLLRLIRFGVGIVATYGIFLFVYKLVTGSFIEIPYLTVNAGDLGELEGKYIDRGGVFKLISTYNNGNIYGISLLMLLPLYTWLQPSIVERTVVKTSLLLTLSRTVWIGLVLHEILHRVYVKRITLRSFSVLLLSLALVAAGVWFALDLLGRDGSFLLDRTLGGRQAQWRDLAQSTLLPAAQFTTIAEIVYLSVLRDFGLIGLCLFVVAMATPLVLHLLGVVPFASTAFKRSIATGLFIYLFIAMGDGAFVYIPVMAIYWFVASLLLSPNPSALHEIPLRSGPKLARRFDPVRRPGDSLSVHA